MPFSRGENRVCLSIRSKERKEKNNKSKTNKKIKRV